MVRLVRGLSVTTHEEISFLLGFIIYIIIHFLFYKPIFAHVMAHELTHMFISALFGGKTKSLHVSREGGKVLVSKSNFLVSLAPYFFPLYAFAATFIYFIARDEYRVYVAFFIGAALSFHIALTLFSLTTKQSDLYEETNIVFSLLFVFFMNIMIIALILSIVSQKVNYLIFMKDTAAGCWEIISRLWTFAFSLLYGGRRR
jgi:F0F1-type ATP synthase assembly protein I